MTKTIEDLKTALLAAEWDKFISHNFNITHIQANYHYGVIYGTMVCDNKLGSIYDCGVYTKIETREYKHLFENKFITIEI